MASNISPLQAPAGLLNGPRLRLGFRARAVRRPLRPPSKPATEKVRYHRPDLVVRGEAPEAIEVELTDKSARRLDEILQAWHRSLAAGQFGRVRYLCSPRALPYVRRAIERIGGGLGVDVEPLEDSGVF